MLSLHVKRSPPLRLHNKSRLKFFTGVYIINRILHARLYVYMNFIVECSTRYLTNERSERVRKRVEHSKIKFISTSGHVIFCLLYNYWTFKVYDLAVVLNKPPLGLLVRVEVQGRSWKYSLHISSRWSLKKSKQKENQQIKRGSTWQGLLVTLTSDVIFPPLCFFRLFFQLFYLFFFGFYFSHQIGIFF